VDLSSIIARAEVNEYRESGSSFETRPGSLVNGQVPFGPGMLGIFGEKHSLDEGKIRFSIKDRECSGWESVHHVSDGRPRLGGPRTCSGRTGLPDSFNRSVPLEEAPGRSFGNPQGAGGKGIEFSGPFVLFDPVAQAEAGMFHGLPQDTDPSVPVGRGTCAGLPFPDNHGIVEVKIQVGVEILQERARSGRTQNSQGARRLHLGPQHHHARNSQAVVGVKMAEGEHLDPRRPGWSSSTKPGRLLPHRKDTGFPPVVRRGR